MTSKERQLVAQLTTLIQAIQNILALEVEAHDCSQECTDLKPLLENCEHTDLTIDFCNIASEAIKHITQLRSVHHAKPHLFVHLDHVIDLVKNATYKHPTLKKSKFTKINPKNAKDVLKNHIIHAKEIIESAEKAYAETASILHSLQQQCELQDITPELTERIKHAVTKMHLMNIAATIATDKIIIINNQLQKI